MTCETCKHLAEIRHAMRFCERCDLGRVHGTVHADASATAERVYANALDARNRNRDGGETVTATLTADAEDGLRKMLADLFALSPANLLLVQHAMRGRAQAAFDDSAADAIRELSGLVGSSHKSAAAHRVSRIKRRMPMLAVIFKFAAAANKGRNKHANARTARKAAAARLKKRKVKYDTT